jgi:hypothetical protein
MAITLETAINSVFNAYGLPLDRFNVLISDSTGRTTITNSSSNFSIKTISTNDNYLCSSYTHPVKDSADSKTGISPTRYIETLGYYLGFRETSYSNSNSYTSEGVFNNKYSSYLYFSLNDYTASQSASNTYALLQNSLIADQILAVIPLNGPRFDFIFDDGANFIYKKRDYFGPVDISKISGNSISNFLTFSSETGNKADVILNYSASNSVYDYTVLLDSAFNVTFENMTIQRGANNFNVYSKNSDLINFTTCDLNYNNNF